MKPVLLDFVVGQKGDPIAFYHRKVCFPRFRVEAGKVYLVTIEARDRVCVAHLHRDNSLVASAAQSLPVWRGLSTQAEAATRRCRVIADAIWAEKPEYFQRFRSVWVVPPGRLVEAQAWGRAAEARYAAAWDSDPVVLAAKAALRETDPLRAEADQLAGLLTRLDYEPHIEYPTEDPGVELRSALARVGIYTPMLLRAPDARKDAPRNFLPIQSEAPPPRAASWMDDEGVGFSEFAAALER